MSRSSNASAKYEFKSKPKNGDKRDHPKTDATDATDAKTKAIDTLDDSSLLIDDIKNVRKGTKAFTLSDFVPHRGQSFTLNLGLNLVGKSKISPKPKAYVTDRAVDRSRDPKSLKVTINNVNEPLTRSNIVDYLNTIEECDNVLDALHARRTERAIAFSEAVMTNYRKVIMSFDAAQEEDRLRHDRAYRKKCTEKTMKEFDEYAAVAKSQKKARKEYKLSLIAKERAQKASVDYTYDNSKNSSDNGDASKCLWVSSVSMFDTVDSKSEHDQETKRKYARKSINYREIICNRGLTEDLWKLIVSQGLESSWILRDALHLLSTCKALRSFYVGWFFETDFYAILSNSALYWNPKAPVRTSSLIFTANAEAQLAEKIKKFDSAQGKIIITPHNWIRTSSIDFRDVLGMSSHIDELSNTTDCDESRGNALYVSYYTEKPPSDSDLDELLRFSAIIRHSRAVYLSYKERSCEKNGEDNFIHVRFASDMSTLRSEENHERRSSHMTEVFNKSYIVPLNGDSSKHEYGMHIYQFEPYQTPPWNSRCMVPDVGKAKNGRHIYSLASKKHNKNKLSPTITSQVVTLGARCKDYCFEVNQLMLGRTNRNAGGVRMWKKDHMSDISHWMCPKHVSSACWCECTRYVKASCDLRDAWTLLFSHILEAIDDCDGAVAKRPGKAATIAGWIASSALHTLYQRCDILSYEYDKSTDDERIHEELWCKEKHVYPAYNVYSFSYAAAMMTEVSKDVFDKTPSPFTTFSELDGNRSETFSSFIERTRRAIETSKVDDNIVKAYTKQHPDSSKVSSPRILVGPASYDKTFVYKKPKDNDGTGLRPIFGPIPDEIHTEIENFGKHVIPTLSKTYFFGKTLVQSIDAIVDDVTLVITQCFSTVFSVYLARLRQDVLPNDTKSIRRIHKLMSEDVRVLGNNVYPTLDARPRTKSYYALLSPVCYILNMFVAISYYGDPKKLERDEEHLKTLKLVTKEDWDEFWTLNTLDRSTKTTIENIVCDSFKKLHVNIDDSDEVWVFQDLLKRFVTPSKLKSPSSACKDIIWNAVSHLVCANHTFRVVWSQTNSRINNESGRCVRFLPEHFSSPSARLKKERENQKKNQNKTAEKTSRVVYDVTDDDDKYDNYDEYELSTEPKKPMEKHHMTDIEANIRIKRSKVNDDRLNAAKKRFNDHIAVSNVIKKPKKTVLVFGETLPKTCTVALEKDDIKKSLCQSQQLPEELCLMPQNKPDMYRVYAGANYLVLPDSPNQPDDNVAWMAYMKKVAISHFFRMKPEMFACKTHTMFRMLDTQTDSDMTRLQLKPTFYRSGIEDIDTKAFITSYEYHRDAILNDGIARNSDDELNIISAAEWLTTERFTRLVRNVLDPELEFYAAYCLYVIRVPQKERLRLQCLKSDHIPRSIHREHATLWGDHRSTKLNDSVETERSGNKRKRESTYDTIYEESTEEMMKDVQSKKKKKRK